MCRGSCGDGCGLFAQNGNLLGRPLLGSTLSSAHMVTEGMVTKGMVTKAATGQHTQQYSHHVFGSGLYSVIGDSNDITQLKCLEVPHHAIPARPVCALSNAVTVLEKKRTQEDARGPA